MSSKLANLLDEAHQALADAVDNLDGNFYVDNPKTIRWYDSVLARLAEARVAAAGGETTSE